MGGPKTAIVTQVVHFYFGAVGQYYFGANRYPHKDAELQT